MFEYEWDEVGRLVRAQRFDGGAGSPAADLRYYYDASDQRVIKRATVGADDRYTVYAFDTLKLRRAEFASDYEYTAETVVPYLLANGVRLARVMWELNPVPALDPGLVHVFFELGDHLGSTSVVLDQATGELVERSTFQAYGGAERDYRPSRWAGFREDYRFTGKEEDVEVGLQYFGKRFLNPLLGRWASFDPLTLHGLGADLNGYACVHGTVLKSVDPLGLEEGTSIDIGNPASKDIAAMEAFMDGEPSITFEDPLVVTAEPKPSTANESNEPSFADQRVEQMKNAAQDSAIEMLEGPVRLLAEGQDLVGMDRAAEMTGAAADWIASAKEGAPKDPRSIFHMKSTSSARPCFTVGSLRLRQCLR